MNKSKKDTVKSLRAKIKKLETKRDETMKVLENLPSVRSGIYAATFAGLTFGYKEGLIDLFPKFFFQFGELGKDPEVELMDHARKAFEAYALDWTGLRFFFPSEPLAEDATPKDADALFAKTIRDLEKQRKEKADLLVVVLGEAVETEGRKQIQKDIDELNAAIARVKADWTKYTLSAYLLAMGLAGATMLFLMETSTSEVANVGAKLLDALTSLT